ncbi:hypothetical protein JZ751_002290 [Albula glossodonta]|uniref:Uncharacterized protein n=1 Tax=Albula glossodonta TaxID=121402 RepID=A0A8T2P7I9_9TELE|nr:hypothetical protein JZ751_002290 [Albula glossodonta]
MLESMGLPAPWLAGPCDDHLGGCLWGRWQEVEALESETKRFEDLEFQQLEKESSLEEERETISQQLLQERVQYHTSVAHRKEKVAALESQANQIGLQAAQECERLAKDRNHTLQLLQKEKDRLSALEKRYLGLTGGRAFPKSANTMKEDYVTISQLNQIFGMPKVDSSPTSPVQSLQCVVSDSAFSCSTPPHGSSLLPSVESEWSRPHIPPLDLERWYQEVMAAGEPSQLCPPPLPAKSFSTRRPGQVYRSKLDSDGGSSPMHPKPSVGPSPQYGVATLGRSPPAKVQHVNHH